MTTAPELTHYHKAISAISGAVITSLIVTPLDVVKTRLQSQSLKASDPICCKTSPQFATCAGPAEVCVAEQTALKRFEGTWEGLVKIARTEGISSLWRGLSPTLFMAIPSTVIYFVGYEKLRKIADSESYFAPLLCGGLARTASATVISPLELLRTRLQSATHQGRSASDSFKQVTAGIRDMVKIEGVQTLWRGLGLTLWRDVPFSALYWLGYEEIKSTIEQNRLVESPFLQSFLSGGVSGTVAALLTTPFDVAKTRKQIVSQNSNVHQSMFRLMKEIRAEEGIRGLWKGSVPRCLKVSPACAIMISSYEMGKRAFSRRHSSVVELGE